MGLAGETRATCLACGLCPGGDARSTIGRLWRLCLAGRSFSGIHLALHLSADLATCLRWARRASAPASVRDETVDEEQHDDSSERDQEAPNREPREPGSIGDGRQPVSYTHLRAHETDSYLVCRLLLEKK